VRIDLHTHSDRSDGSDRPAALVRRAHERGIDVLGLADHDTSEGWEEAADAAERVGVTLVRGLEVSCAFAGYGVHLLAYLPDPTYPPLAAELERILDGRNSRLPAILARLRELGIDIDVHDVRRLAGDAAAIGRPHVADVLVDKGVVADRDDAFEKYLGPQGPAYVNRYAADLVTMIGLVSDAGGVTVLAHPWAVRHNHDALDEHGMSLLQHAGLAGIEVEHQDHDQATRAALRTIARELGLVSTGASDYHGTGKVAHELGCNLTRPEEYQRLMDLAAVAASNSDRAAPRVVSG
jgi:predicted metal-dependent phosphoesterase TrpH